MEKIFPVGRGSEKFTEFSAKRLKPCSKLMLLE